jgi:hypothetical protein
MRKSASFRLADHGILMQNVNSRTMTDGVGATLRAEQ